jgi:hypothetical protein
VSEYGIAVAHPGCGRNPATSNAAFKQLVSIGCVVLESDRSNSAESGCVKQHEKVREHLKDDVVSKLVLSDYFEQPCWGLETGSPMHSSFKRPQRFKSVEDVGVH